MIPSEAEPKDDESASCFEKGEMVSTSRSPILAFRRISLNFFGNHRYYSLFSSHYKSEFFYLKNTTKYEF